MRLLDISGHWTETYYVTVVGHLMPQIDTVFENHRKCLILQHCERSQLRLQKFIKNAKNSQFDEF